MMSSTAVRLGALAMLLAVVQAASEVHKPKHKGAHHAAAHGKKHKHKAVHAAQNSFMRSEVGHEDDWHVHGAAGSQWKWSKNADGHWERKDVTADEAKEAEAPAPAEAPAHAPEAAGDSAAAEAARAAADVADADAADAAHADSVKKECTTPNAMVNLDVYYETRCPGCMLFINQTLEPLWREDKLKSVLNITMYTFGNGQMVPIDKISEGYRFFHSDTTNKSKGWTDVQICQHGSDECLGNLVQVCAKHIASHEKHMELIFCMTSATIDGYAEENAAYTCLEKSGIDKDKVRDCVTSPHGSQLAMEASTQTDMLKNRLGTPWVMVGGDHVENDALMNGTLLVKHVCAQVCNAPEPCSAWASHAKVASPAAAPAPAPADHDDGDDFTVLAGKLTADDFFIVGQDKV